MRTASLRVCITYPTGGDNWKPLLGMMLEATLEEGNARKELKKWQPVRRLYRDFTKRGGAEFNGANFRVYARVFTRDLYHFDWAAHRPAGEQEAAFVLTLRSVDAGDTIYNSTVNALGNFVESAVLNQEIDVQNR